MAFRGAGGNFIDSAAAITKPFSAIAKPYYGVEGVSQAIVSELDPLLQQMISKSAFKM